MVYSAIRDAVEAEILTIENYGTVFDYWPISGDTGKFVESFISRIESADIVRTWIIRVVGTAQNEIIAGQITQNVVVEVRHYEGIRKPPVSEYAYLDNVESAIYKMSNKSDYGISEVRFVHQAQLTSNTTRMLGSVMCHSAEITQNVQVTLGAFTGG